MLCHCKYLTKDNGKKFGVNPTNITWAAKDLSRLPFTDTFLSIGNLLSSQPAPGVGVWRGKGGAAASARGTSSVPCWHTTLASLPASRSNHYPKIPFSPPGNAAEIELPNNSVGDPFALGTPLPPLSAAPQLTPVTLQPDPNRTAIPHSALRIPHFRISDRPPVLRQHCLGDTTQVGQPGCPLKGCKPAKRGFQVKEEAVSYHRNSACLKS